MGPGDKSRHESRSRSSAGDSSSFEAAVEAPAVAVMAKGSAKGTLTNASWRLAKGRRVKKTFPKASMALSRCRSLN